MALPPPLLRCAAAAVLQPQAVRPLKFGVDLTDTGPSTPSLLQWDRMNPPEKIHEDLPLALVSAAGGESALVRLVLEQMPVGLCVFDGDDRLLFSNRRYLDVWKLPATLGARGTHFADIMASTQGSETEQSRSQSQPETGSSGTRRREWQLSCGRRIEVVATRFPDGSCVAVHEDVTARRDAEARIVHLAMHDALTSLPNRVRLHDEFEQQLQRHARGEDLALLCLDLDRFKIVNDVHGHQVGDLLLKEVALRLRQCARETDTLARLGGDEFAILQCGAAQPAASTHLARRIVSAMAQPFHLAGQVLRIGASVGISISPFDGDTSQALHKNADLALYRAKAEGRGTFRYFEPQFDQMAQLRRGLEADLHGAVARGELELLYQPLMGAHNNRVCGFEALLRWNHPHKGVISPADFIPLAEETGLMIEIGRWVLMQACREATQWAPEVRVAVNVSAVQFLRGSLLRDVTSALQASGLAPDRLEIEITESVMLNDQNSAAATLKELHQRGVRIAMDDFGTGYSSLNLLRNFPFDRIKIDRSFVCDLGQRDDALPIIRAVVGLGRSLGIETTVEGVETELQLRTVRAEGCGEVQGYWYSRPVRAADLQALTIKLNQTAAVPSVITEFSDVRIHDTEAANA
jgi:diguanylate cyclase (GGDEF)-like protein